MRGRIGTGPVFSEEWLTASLRWQADAARSLFVDVLLAGWAVVWRTESVGPSS